MNHPCSIGGDMNEIWVSIEVHSAISGYGTSARGQLEHYSDPKSNNMYNIRTKNEHIEQPDPAITRPVRLYPLAHQLQTL